MIAFVLRLAERRGEIRRGEERDDLRLETDDPQTAAFCFVLRCGTTLWPNLTNALVSSRSGVLLVMLLFRRRLLE